MEDVILSMRGIVKAFPGVVALGGVDFEVRRGEVRGLVGENGAGKSTLMNVLGGLLRPDAGQVFLEGGPVSIHGPVHASALGIGFVHQETNLLPNLSVLENVFLSREMRKTSRSLDREGMAREVLRAGETFGYRLDPHARLGDLSLAQQQSVEITRALLFSPRILMLDEPTAALDNNEAEHLFALIGSLKGKGVSVIYITHRLDEIGRVADSVTVMKDGKNVGTLARGEMDKGRMIRMMVGRVLEDIFPDRSNARFGPDVLKVSGLSAGAKVRGADFSVRAGEILGIGGLEGQGQREALRAVFGDVPVLEGSVLVDGTDVTRLDLRGRVRRGIGYMTHDRRGEGLVLSLSLGRNASLAALHRFRGPLGLVLRRREREEVRGRISALQIKATGENQEVNTLSGGNQQKVMLSRWLLTNPRVLLIDEPTKGVDVGARVSVYQIIEGLARQGIAVVVLTSDMMELIGLCDRILVFCEGRITARLARGEATEQRIIRAASGMEESA